MNHIVNIENYMQQLIEALKAHFHDRLFYVGLQGSYLRGEATPDSDLDIMVIIENLGVHDLDDYRSILHSLDFSEKSCGFICSNNDLIHWNPLEISHLLHTTKDYFGALQKFVPSYTEQDIRNFVKMSINNLYHELCHRYIHADIQTNILALPNSYKAVFFILQNLYALNHGKFICTKAELLTLLEGIDHAVLKRSIDLQHCKIFDFQESFSLLFTWCQETLRMI